jgi:phytoene desaturase
MSMIPHLEHGIGTYIPEGGMYAIIEGLVKLAGELGISFHFGELVEEIIHDQKKVSGVKTDKQTMKADAVVSNSDVNFVYSKLLHGVPRPEKTLAQEKSSSALIFYWGIKHAFPELDLHNIFFSQDYENEFKKIFKEQTVGDDPTVYINITSKDCPKDAPEGGENWFVMVNVPANKGQDWHELTRVTKINVLNKLSRLLGREIEPLIETEHVLSPIGIENKTRSHLGALYGSSSNNRFSAFLRHANFSKHLKGLYFCGGSVHPGGGIPLCLYSAQIVSKLVASHYRIRN